MRVCALNTTTCDKDNTQTGISGCSLELEKGFRGSTRLAWEKMNSEIQSKTLKLAVAGNKTRSDCPCHVPYGDSIALLDASPTTFFWGRRRIWEGGDFHCICCFLKLFSVFESFSLCLTAVFNSVAWFGDFFYGP